MALGVPVVCTNYGGTTDFAKQDLAWPVNVASFSTPSIKEYSIFPVLKGIRWAEPDLEHLKAQMRACYEDANARKQKAELGAVYVEENFKDEVIANQLKDAILSKDPEMWEQLTELSIKVPPKMKDDKTTMLEV
jgi:hypothetical protein